MTTNFYLTGKSGRTIVKETFLTGTNLKHTVVIFPNGDSESRFSRNPFCKY